LFREKEEAEAKISAQAVDAFAIIGDLDSALKAFQGALGLSDVRTFLNREHHCSCGWPNVTVSSLLWLQGVVMPVGTRFLEIIGQFTGRLLRITRDY